MPTYSNGPWRSAHGRQKDKIAGESRVSHCGSRASPELLAQVLPGGEAANYFMWRRAAAA